MPVIYFAFLASSRSAWGLFCVPGKLTLCLKSFAECSEKFLKHYAAFFFKYALVGKNLVIKGWMIQNI